MTDRIIDFSESPVKLSARGELLVIDPDINGDQKEVTVPFCDIAAVVSSHPRMIMTCAALSGLAKRLAIVVVCDEKYTPSSMMLPLAGHGTQTERFARQAAASAPTNKQIWAQIARAKVRSQARVLEDIHGDDAGLCALAERVKSGDPDNIEAQASRRYWPLLFGNPDFHRDRDAPGPNILLNYGYMVLRAITARALCAAGLHPSLGTHHHNRYDAFCLASDVMEPFRAIVDRAVVGMVRELGPAPPLDKTTKPLLLAALTTRFPFKNESRTLFDILSKTAVSLDNIYAGKSKKLALPDL